MFNRSRQADIQVRRPHADPRVEARLQAIMALRRSAARTESQIEAYRCEIGELHDQLRESADDVSHKYLSLKEYERIAGSIEARITGLQEEIRKLEPEVPAAHDEIARRMDGLDDIQLSYLDPV